MKFSIEVDPAAIKAALDEEMKAVGKRVRSATEIAGRELLLEPVRADTRSALSARLANTWRGRVYPEGSSTTLSPAFFVWSKAAEVIYAFETGAEITPVTRRFLAIPTADAGIKAGSGRTPRVTPQSWSRETGVKLRFVPKGNGGLLVADARYARKSSGDRLRLGRPIRTKLQGDGGFVVIFILVRRAHLRKRLDVQGIAASVGASYAARYHRAANSQ